jgi:succinyl-diaminopimelate desuccinylase
VKEAMEKSMAEGSQTFEEDLARLIMEGKIDRKEGLAYADSPTNLMWRLQNDFALAANAAKAQKEARDTPTTNPRSPKSCWTSKAPDPVSPAFSCHVPHPAPGRTAHLPPSITPDDAGCLDLLAAAPGTPGLCLRTPGQRARQLPCQQLVGKKACSAYGTSASSYQNNSICRPHRCGAHRPAGAVEQHPFTPTHKDGKLYGRGASDMKTSIAAFVVAVEEFLAATPTRSSIAFLLTSDEEGPSSMAPRWWWSNSKRARRADRLLHRGRAHLGRAHRRHDQERPPRHAQRQAHRARHPGPHRLPATGAQPHPPGPARAGRTGRHRVGQGNAFFPPTSWQISNIHGGTGASNVIPGDVVVDFNFRFCTESTPKACKQRVHAVLDRQELEYDLQWTLGGQPFLTTPGELVTQCSRPSGETGWSPPNCPPPAAPATAASSPRSARR